MYCCGSPLLFKVGLLRSTLSLSIFWLADHTFSGKGPCLEHVCAEACRVFSSVSFPFPTSLFTTTPSLMLSLTHAIARLPDPPSIPQLVLPHPRSCWLPLRWHPLSTALLDQQPTATSAEARQGKPSCPHILCDTLTNVALHVCCLLPSSMCHSWALPAFPTVGTLILGATLWYPAASIHETCQNAIISEAFVKCGWAWLMDLKKYCGEGDWHRCGRRGEQMIT